MNLIGQMVATEYREETIIGIVIEEDIYHCYSILWFMKDRQFVYKNYEKHNIEYFLSIFDRYREKLGI